MELNTNKAKNIITTTEKDQENTIHFSHLPETLVYLGFWCWTSKIFILSLQWKFTLVADYMISNLFDNYIQFRLRNMTGIKTTVQQHNYMDGPLTTSELKATLGDFSSEKLPGCGGLLTEVHGNITSLQFNMQ